VRPETKRAQNRRHYQRHKQQYRRRKQLWMSTHRARYLQVHRDYMFARRWRARGVLPLARFEQIEPFWLVE